jgi:3-oxoadipate enol-lactonase
MKVKANGITFNFEISGPDNAPWLIFSNSLATNLHMWDPQAADLKGEFRTLRYDQRGHGETEATAGRYTFELLCGDVIALMDVLGIQRAHWCGVSMGCATGMGLVQKHPGRFDRIVLCDNPGRSSRLDTATDRICTSFLRCCTISVVLNEVRVLGSISNSR